MQPFKIAIRIDESGNGSSSDSLINADRLAGLVVDEVNFRQAEQLGLIVHHTDAEREYAYDRKSPFGRLDAAAANG